MTSARIAEAIQKRRGALRLSMRAAAAAGGMSPTAWSDLEAGKHPPTPATQRKIATALQWPIDWLDVVTSGGEPITRPVGAPLDQLHALAELTERVAALAELVAQHDAQLVSLTNRAGPTGRRSAQAR